MPTTRRTKTRTVSSRGKDAIALLQADHKKVRGLLRKLEKAEKGDPRKNIFNQIEKELKIHTRIEEEIFYPAYRDAAPTKDRKLYYEAKEEHHVVDMVLPEMKGSNVSSEVFAAKAKVLKELVEHHADEEESDMFPKARRALGPERLKELGTQLQTRKEQLSSGMWDRALDVLTPFTRTKTRKRAA